MTAATAICTDESPLRMLESRALPLEVVKLPEVKRDLVLLPQKMDR